MLVLETHNFSLNHLFLVLDSFGALFPHAYAQRRAERCREGLLMKTNTKDYALHAKKFSTFKIEFLSFECFLLKSMHCFPFLYSFVTQDCCIHLCAQCEMHFDFIISIVQFTVKNTSSKFAWHA